MQEVVGSSPTVSTISAASHFSEVKKTESPAALFFFYFCFNSPPSLYIQGVFRNNVALRFATLTAAPRSDESYCLYHFGGFGLVAKNKRNGKISVAFLFLLPFSPLLSCMHCLCEARSAAAIRQTKYFILSVNEISHRTIDKPDILSLRQCQESKLACKGLRTMIFIRHLHF